MTRHFLIGAVIVAILNGIFSPYVLAVFLFYPLWYPGWAPAYTEVVVAIASILLSTLTLMVAGVPAALVERLRGKRESDEAPAMLWFAGTVILALPALPSILRALGFG